MMEDKVYYYGDSAGNPVGPLTLEEIQNFVKAGVIPPEVMICEAGGEDWQCLQALDAGSSISAPSEVVPTSQLRESSAPDDPVVAARRLKTHYNLAIVSSLIAFGLDASSTRAAIENGGIDPQSARNTLSILDC